jgi:hypothetical protein
VSVATRLSRFIRSQSSPMAPLRTAGGLRDPRTCQSPWPMLPTSGFPGRNAPVLPTSLPAEARRIDAARGECSKQATQAPVHPPGSYLIFPTAMLQGAGEGHRRFVCFLDRQIKTFLPGVCEDTQEALNCDRRETTRRGAMRQQSPALPGAGTGSSAAKFMY